MNKYILIIFSAIAAVSFTSKTFAQGETNIETQQLDELDLIYDMMEQTLGTTECLTYTNKLFEKAAEYDNYGYQIDAAFFKINAYIALSDYEQAIAYADSITEALSLKTGHPRYYYDTKYLKCVAYINTGKYKSAIELATQLYDDARNEIQSDSSQLELVVRCNALSSLGLANAEMGNLNEAYQNYTEGINAINEETENPEFLSQLLQLQTNRMMLANKYPDKERALAILNQYKKEVDEFNEKKIGTNAENMFIADWEMQMEMYYIVVLCDLNRIEEAGEHLQTAQQIFDTNTFVEQYSAEFLLVKSKYYTSIGEYSLGIVASDSAAAFYKESGDRGREIDAISQMWKQLYALGKYKESAEAANRVILLKDSLSEQRYKSSVEEMTTLMGVNKLESEKQQLEAQRRAWILLAAFVLMAAAVVFFIFKRRRDMERQRILASQKQMLEEEVARQTCELREQKEVIEQKNRDITDSINYALRIQQSILPDMAQYTPEVGVEGAFALFIPCHIVSGDFYWTYQRDHLLFFSSVDCTGHGVPGAFMSMIGTTILNDLCKRPEELAPNEVLEQLHINLLAVLQQSGDSDSRDGMDMSILEYNTITHHVRVSSARRPVYLHINGEFVEYKGVKRSIGERDYTQETLPFSLGEYDVKPGDSVYMCSDGIGDQFGGPKNKRLKSSGLMNMLNELVQMPIGEQQAAIDKMYWDWRGDQEQLDDISLIGVKF